MLGSAGALNKLWAESRPHKADVASIILKCAAEQFGQVSIALSL